jgi:hypothetical protein
MNSLKDSRVQKKNIFFKTHQVTKKGGVEKYTLEWETHVTQVSELSQDQLLQSYVSRLKPHKRNGMEMHSIKLWKKLVVMYK